MEPQGDRSASSHCSLSKRARTKGRRRQVLTPAITVQPQASQDSVTGPTGRTLPCQGHPLIKGWAPQASGHRPQVALPGVTAEVEPEKRGRRGNGGGRGPRGEGGRRSATMQWCLWRRRLASAWIGFHFQGPAKGRASKFF